MAKRKTKKLILVEDIAYSQFIWSMLEHKYGEVDPKLAHMLLGVASEGCEVLDVLKAAVCYHEAIDKKKLQLELGDLLFFIRATCLYFGWSEDDLRQMNMKKLIKRCPDGFNVEDHKAGKSKK